MPWRPSFRISSSIDRSSLYPLLPAFLPAGRHWGGSCLAIFGAASSHSFERQDTGMNGYTRVQYTRSTAARWLTALSAALTLLISQGARADALTNYSVQLLARDGEMTGDIALHKDG